MFASLRPVLIGACCTLACLLMSADAVRASDFVTELEVKSAAESVKTKFTETSPADGEPHKRPVFRAQRAERLRVVWRAANTSKKDTFEDVLVHFFVVKEEKVGQKKVPDLAKDVYHEGAITMDFKPADKAHGEFILKIVKPGSYLIRIETAGMRLKHGHDHYAAIDLVIE